MLWPVHARRRVKSANGASPKSRFWAAVIAAVASITVLVILGIAYQNLENLADQRRYPEPGRRVNIGARKLLLNCSGAGNAVVVLESGLGDVSVEWQPVQSAVSRFARVCSYDRAGYGGSDEGPYPRTSASISDDLHALLHAAGEQPPYIIVGHSFGGYNARVFRGRYPKEVSGVVLIDSVQEDQYRLLPPLWKQIEAELLRKWNSQARRAPVEIGVGYTRLRLGKIAHEPFFYLYLEPKYLRTRANELQNIHVSAEQARAAGSMERTPLIVLSAGKPLHPANGLTEEDAREYDKIWVHELQPMLARLSLNGRQVIVESGHNMPADNPSAVAAAIKQLYDQQLQVAKAPPANR